MGTLRCPLCYISVEYGVIDHLGRDHRPDESWLFPFSAGRQRQRRIRLVLAPEPPPEVMNSEADRWRDLCVDSHCI